MSAYYNKYPYSIKYLKIVQNTKLFEELKQKADKIKDIVVLKKLKKQKTIWTKQELMYLTYGVYKIGRKWVEIYDYYREFFKEDRSSGELCSKYSHVEKDPKKIKYFLNQAIILIEKK